MAAQQQIQLAAKMYNVRDTAKRLVTPAVYRERIGEFKDVILKTMEHDKTEVLPATMSLCQQVRGDAFLNLWFVAAAVELIEPSEGVAS